MENINSNNKESGINRVVGFESEKEKDFLEYFKEQLENDDFEFKEKEKTSEQLEMIERINQQMNDFLEKYGIKAINIPENSIHILDRSAYEPEEIKEIGDKLGSLSGVHSSNNQNLVILQEYDISKVSFYQTIVHEMLHAQSFNSYQKSDEEFSNLTLKNKDNGESADMKIRRSGFAILPVADPSNKIFFKMINESIITELQIRFKEEYMNDWPELKDELQEKDRVIKQISESEQDEDLLKKFKKEISYLKENNDSEYKLATYPYADERQKFDKLIDDLYEKNKEDFNSKEEVFSLFAKATMTGRILGVARLIEKTFGKGSFREIGDKSSTHEDFNS